jgi:hypothetical protein
MSDEFRNSSLLLILQLLIAYILFTIGRIQSGFIAKQNDIKTE